jgi:hypothetical protein
MRAFRFLNLAILSVLVASSAVLYAQDEKQQENKPPQQEEPKRQAEPQRHEEPKQQEEARPAGKQDEMKAPRQEESRPSNEKRQEPNSGDRSREQMQAGRQEGQAHGRPAGKSARIPDERFRAQFGRSHTFVAQRPVVVEGQPRFQYGGYTFVLVDEWPAEWTYTDDVFIDYVDGDYFLYDLAHPGIRIALFVIM